MNGWLKRQLDAPGGLDRFAGHFASNTFGERREAAKNILSQFHDGDVNAVVGPYGRENEDIFKRLDDGVQRKPPAGVNGLDQLGFLRESASGERHYSGHRSDGETVVYNYDAYGNLHGTGDRGNYYFQKNALNGSHAPLTPLTKEQYGQQVVRTANDNVGMNDMNGLYQEFIQHLENPAYGISDALDRAGVPKDIANASERYLNNPIGSALVDINKASHNWFGKQMSKLYGRDVDETEMNGMLEKFGRETLAVVPGYGRTRFLCDTVACALKGELPEEKDQRETQQLLKEIGHDATAEHLV
jgi:hypothetical protein